MKKTNLLLVAFMLIIVAACNKDQKVVKQLDGTWKVSSIVVDGTPEPASSFDDDTYTFNSCKVKKDDCDGTITTDGMSIPFTYNVSEKGKKFSMTMNFFGFSFSQTGDILEHSKDKFVFLFIEDGERTETTLVKK